MSTRVRNVVPLRPPADRWSEDPAELNLRVLFCLACYLRDTYGEETMARVAHAAGFEPSDLDGKARWISAKRFAALLAAARAELSSDEEFFEACVYRYARTRGLGRYLITLRSPIDAYQRGCAMFAAQSRISTLEFTRLGDRKLRLVYTTTREETRLMCRSRMASLTAVPTLWDLPRALLEAKRCVHDGHPCCEYELTVYESSRRFPAALGAFLGTAASAIALALDGGAAWVLLPPLLGAVTGHLLETSRVNRHNLATGERAHEVLRGIASDDAEARRELNELQRRQNEWLVLMEERLAERTFALQEVVQRIRAFQASTHTTIRGLSHDIRNPLHSLALEADLLALHQDKLGPLGPEIVQEHVSAVHKIEQLLHELIQYVTTERLSMELAPAVVDVAALTERIRRQLRALSHGKPIRVSVFRVREAPERVIVDTMLLDRIIDNLLTNAAKYTEHGSIVVEVGGTPGFLTLKISDTGRGIDPERLETAFVGGKTSPSDRTSGGYGIGLSVVIDLLRRIDGKIEVMSKPNVGTTFWVHVPIDTSDGGVDEEEGERSSSEILTIRRSAS